MLAAVPGIGPYSILIRAGRGKRLGDGGEGAERGNVSEEIGRWKSLILSWGTGSGMLDDWLSEEV